MFHKCVESKRFCQLLNINLMEVDELDVNGGDQI